MRLIDADELIGKLRRMPVFEKNNSVKHMMYVEKSCIDAMPTVDAVEVVHSRFVHITDFGDGEGCFGYCERCGSIHHAQHPTALKADCRWCRWCGAKMDGGTDNEQE